MTYFGSFSCPTVRISMYKCMYMYIYIYRYTYIYIYTCISIGFLFSAMPTFLRKGSIWFDFFWLSKFANTPLRANGPNEGNQSPATNRQDPAYSKSQNIVSILEDMKAADVQSSLFMAVPGQFLRLTLGYESGPLCTHGICRLQCRRGHGATRVRHAALVFPGFFKTK